MLPVGSPQSSNSTQEALGALGAPHQQAPVHCLPPNTRVTIVGNNRTAARLIGLQAIVKRANGLGGWHWLVLPSGEEIKLQRNALVVEELGPPESQESSDDDEPAARALEPAHLLRAEPLDRPRVRCRMRSLSPVPEIFKRSSCSPGGSARGGGSSRGAARAPSPLPEGVDLSRLEAASLRRYCRAYSLEGIATAAPRGELASAATRHFRSQLVTDESGVLLAFCAALRRRSSSG